MKTAFMFSGQGAEKLGMGKDLFEKYQIVQDKFECASKSLGFSIKEICFEKEDSLKDTEFAQPALLTTSMAILDLLKDKGVNADYVFGLSLGEYSAFVASGALKFEETVKLVNKRGQLMKEAFVGLECGMTAVLNTPIDEIKEVVSMASDVGVLEVANYNTSKQIVISGEKIALEKAHNIFTERKIKFIPLAVRGAFHTSLLHSASEKLGVELEKLTINDIETTVVTNVDASFVNNKEVIVDTLKTQLKSSVLFEQSVLNLINEGVTRFVEIGTGKTLASFVKKIDKSVEVINIEDVETFEKAIEILCKE